ncbi:hypothetical protein [Aeromonas sobria]|uniref:hypothetical protein n=1 Tax=Aeromonas sobria TaxID=646 RepID=UPI000C6EF9AC|nr:hypothetical protein [Aeromonas sobria]PKQ73657.1 hypothetical protein CJF47_15830 [Aeromonas sobria]
MSLDRLKQYLSRIEQGTPVNLSKVTDLLSQLALSRPFKHVDITARKVKGPLYCVTHIDSDLMAELEHLIATAGHDRVSSARQNRSHNHKVNGSLFLIRQGVHHPSVVLFDEAGNYQYPNKLSRFVLLIENRQNFISIDKTILFLQRNTALASVCIDELDIVFASGNEVSNGLHKAFFDQYHHIYFCFDLDLGGLTIARNMISLLPDKPISFLVPSDIDTRLGVVTEVQPSTYIHDVINIGLECAQLIPYAKLIKDHQRILEQESYLYGE